MSADVIVGIDLGTTNSLVAVVEASGPRVLGGIVPSAVRYEDAGVVVGEDARSRAPEFPGTTVLSVKRLMGRSIEDVRNDLAFFGHPVISGSNETVRAQIGTDEFSPEQVSAEILRELKARAERDLGHDVSKAVITVPAYFDDAQRQATRHAGRLAGLEVVRIVNEPTAAALAYGLGLTDSTRTIAVYDLGGGTFDVSILRLTPSDAQGEPAFFEVLATAGDTRLGGDDADHLLVQLFCGEMNERFGTSINLRTLDGLPPATRKALIAFAQAVKHKLSSDDHASVSIDLGEGRTYDRVVTRDEFEAMIEPWIERTRKACERALRDARDKLDGDSIDALVMVGGSTRIPLVRARAGEVFGVEPYTAIDPDRVVALGAAVQAGILSGATSGALLLDVIPLSLGVETAGGAVAKLIMRNSTVPARATERFSTQADGQTSVKLNVVQGEREMVADCRSLGEFHLTGLPPMPAGVPKLEVEFMVDANGVLTVSAVEQRSGKRARLQVVPNHGLSSEDVDRIEAESITHAREDMTRHRITDLIANAKLDLKWIGGSLERHRGALGELATELDAKMEALSDLIAAAEADWQSVDPDEFNSVKEALERASVRLQEVAIAASLRDEQA